MARQARQTQKSSVFSIKQKTQDVLFRDKEDRQTFVDILKESKEMYGFELFAYCLLDEDEFWLIINAKNRSIASIMQSITISYALYRSDVENLFSNRYSSKPIFDEASLKKEIDILKSDRRYDSCHYCFYHPLDNIPLPFISLVEKGVKINLSHPKRLDDEACIKLIEKKTKEKPIESIEQRNEFIRYMIANYNITQRQLATYFDLSSSSISKILRQSA